MALDASPKPPAELVRHERPIPDIREDQPAGARGARFWLVVETIRTLRSLVILGLLLFITLVAVNFTSTAGQWTQRLNGAWARTEQGFAATGQAIADAFNPTHPPRYPISQDTEFASLFTVRAGETVGDSLDYQFTLSSIRRRDDAQGNPDFAQYALLDRRYKTPRETKLLGITIRVDRGEQQYVLDRGETFRLGTRLYKVNWISSTDQQMALGVYRDPDRFAGKLAFDAD